MSQRVAALTEAGEDIQWDFGKLPQQLDFLCDNVTYKMFSGAFGCGKTTILNAAVIALLLGVPNNMGYLGRADGKALRASTLQKLFEMFPDDYYTKNDQQGFLRVKPQYGGSKLIYGDLKDLNDLKNLPLGFFAIDQCEEVDQAAWDFLVGRLRRKTPILLEGKRQYWVQGKCKARDGNHKGVHGGRRCILCNGNLPDFSEALPKKTADNAPRARPWELICYPRYGLGVCNPEGPSHWIYQYFAGLPGAQNVVSGPGLPGYKGYHATTYDALEAGFVDELYVSDLENQYKIQAPAMYDRYMLGVWVEADGLVYPGWNRGLSMIDRHARRFDDTELLKPDLPLYEHLDPATGGTTANGWVVIEPCECGCEQENYWVVEEHYLAAKVVSHHAQCIKMKRQSLPYPLQATYIDSQCMSRTLMGQKGTPREDELYSIADEYNDHGILVIPNQKNWDVGYNKINEALNIDPKHQHPVTGQMGAPHLYIFSHCKHYIHEFETYKWKKKRTNSEYGDEPVDGGDDLLDGLNGFLASRPSPQGGLRVAHADDDRPSWLNDLDAELLGAVSHMAS